MPLLEEGNCLSPDALAKIAAHADMLDCECPTHLIEILGKIRTFAAYAKSCIERFPEDKKTHLWLKQSADNLDALVSSTIVQLARIEGFVDERNEFVPRNTPKK